MRYRIEAGGRAIGIDGNRLVSPAGSFDRSFTLPAGELRAGLINAHDHLHRNHYPRLGCPPYEDAYQWGRDLHSHFADEIARARALPRRDALLFGALKNLLGAVTTVVHHDNWERDFDDAFPIRVVPLRTIHSPGFDRAALAAAADGGRAAPLAIHLAEGVGSRVADEVRLLDTLGLLDERLLAVHVVGADADGIERLRRAGAAVVWCPASNHFLFHRSCPRELLTAVDVLLGTDSLLTGSGTLLDELGAARAAGCLDDERLEQAVGETAARRLGLPRPCLEPGQPADLVVLRQPLLAARSPDVALVIVNGQPRLGEPRFAALFRDAHVPTDHIVVAGERRLVATPLGTVAGRVLQQWPDCARLVAA